MKGVSDIIAIILILLITISLAGLAYLWFTGIFEQISGGVGNQTQNQVNAMATQFSIETAISYEGANKVGVVIRNTGTADLNMQNLATYVNNVLYTGRELTVTILPPQSYTPFNITGVPNDGCPNLPLRITSGTGAEDTLTIICDTGSNPAIEHRDGN